MRKKLMASLFSLMIIVAGSLTLATPAPARADACGDCEAKEGCTLCASGCENGWTTCTYACYGAECPAVDN